MDWIQISKIYSGLWSYSHFGIVGLSKKLTIHKPETKIILLDIYPRETLTNVHEEFYPSVAEATVF